MAADWTGMDVVCMASGPSLTKSDVEKVRKWRKSGKNRRVIVTNNTYQLAPWADVLYGMDSKWWKVMEPEFSGECLTAVDNAPGANKSSSAKGGNSGAGAMLLAAHRGAKTIIMLGYDCKIGEGGIRHWHGAHKAPLGNAVSLPTFYGHFKDAAAKLKNVDVVNCSRATKLDIWPLQRLEDALAGVKCEVAPNCYWRSNVDLHNLTPKGLRFPEVGLFDSLREACQGSVFEVGCGDGRLSPAFDSSTYIGMDVNPAALKKARIDNPAYRYVDEWLPADTVLAYTVLLHISDKDIGKMMDKLKQYPRIVIGEIMGRKWRTSGAPPVFNREVSEYEAFLGPVKRIIRVPYPHYGTELELCVW